MPPQWDYRVEPLSLVPGHMENALKGFGWEGWELVTILYPQGTAGAAWTVPVAVFRRQVTSDCPMTPARFK